MEEKSLQNGKSKSLSTENRCGWEANFYDKISNEGGTTEASTGYNDMT